MRALSTEFKVGIFTLVAAVTIGYMLFVLNPKSFDSGKYKTYFTIMPDAGGIIPKSQVKTNGVIVGRVKGVDLESNTTRISMEVRGDVKIPKGSRIEIRSRGLLGDTFLEIIRGEDTGEYVPDGGYLPRSTEETDLRALFALLNSIGRDLKQITATAAKVFGGEKGAVALDNIVTNIETITRDAKDIVSENRKDMRAIIANIEKTTASLRKAIGEKDRDMVAIVDNVKSATDDLKVFAANMRDVLNDENKEKIERIIAAFDDSMAEVKGATKNINLISDKVNKGEGTIGKLINDDTTITEIEGAVKDIREVIAPVNKLEIIVDYHKELRHDETSQDYFNVALQPRPDRYYLVGMTTVQDDVITTTTETTDNTPASDGQNAKTTTVETRNTENHLKFNLQFAKRWYFAGLRFGLFETTGGVASDLYLFRDNMRMSLEAFDWDTRNASLRRTAHFKTYASILFFNHVYAIGGLDDFTRTDQESRRVQTVPNYFFGAGLTFNDKDLKTLFGAAALGSVAK